MPNRRRRYTLSNTQRLINQTTGVNRGMTVVARRNQSARQIQPLSAITNPNNRYYPDIRRGTPVYSRATGEQIGTYAGRAH